MGQRGLKTTFGHPTPELPVADVERAQQHYRDVLGFEIDWLSTGKQIGAVSRDKVAIFFRRRSRPFEPSVHWYLRRTSMPRTTSCARSAHESSSPWTTSPGVCVNSPWKTWMATASIFIATRPARDDNSVQRMSLRAAANAGNGAPDQDCSQLIQG